MSSKGKHWNLTIEQRKKHGDAIRGIKRSIETKLKLRNKMLGTKHALGSKRSDLSLRNKLNPLFGINNPFYGKKHTEETIAKNRERRLFQVFPLRETYIEIAIQNALKKRSIVFTTQKFILGRPDIFVEPNIAVFCDGDYWHNRSGARERDNYVNETLTKQGYKVIRLWEHEINNNLDWCINKINDTVYGR